MTTIQVRRGTAAQWTSAATVLAAGELGLDTTYNILKLGDGSTAWASLNPTLNNTYVQVFKPAAYGTVDTTGSADCSTAVNAALAAAYTAGGGVVELPVGTLRINGLVLPTDGDGVFPRTCPIVIRGAGPQYDSRLASNVMTGGTVLDLRSTTGPAKVDARGVGILILERLTFTQKGSAADTNPFIQTTNTALLVRDCVFIGHSTLSGTACVQDAVVLGGTTTTTNNAGSDNAFQGYGTVIERCKFDRIRRGVYARTFANAVKIQDNTWAATCGADSTAAALHLDGTVGFSSASAVGNLILGNLIECTGYVYGIRFNNARWNACVGNSFFDDAAGLVACHYFENTCTNNHINDLHVGIAETKWVTDASGGNHYSMIQGGYFYPERLRGAVTIVEPYAATGVESTTSFTVKRPANEATFPSDPILQVQQRGEVIVGTANTTVANVVIKNGATTTTIDHTSMVRSSGNLDIYAGTTATDMVRFQRGLIQLPRYTTVGRPAASTGAGACYYDTTVSKPVFSDGSTWRDAAGTAV